MKKVQADSFQFDKSDRKFKKPNSISQCLKCSICMEVFHEPTRLFCGHTYCLDCLEGWKKIHKNCPFCREKIDEKNIGRDLMAYNVINEQEVFCIHEDCSWQGTLEVLKLHVQFECLYNDIKKTNNDMKQTRVVDEEVEEKINENAVRGNLISRVLMKGGGNSKSFDVGYQFIRTESMSVSNPPRLKESRDRQQIKTKEEPPKYENYDYLLDLYETSK